MLRLDPRHIHTAVRAALAEDLGPGDVTTQATVPARATLNVILRAREPLVVAGLPLAEATFRQRSPRIRVHRLTRDGQPVPAGASLLRLRGPARAILSAERVALNYLQHLSGVATHTAQYVAAIRGTRTRILDTRKTTPGMRVFEKYAVACGGGKNHRLGLFDMVLIKDNHLAALECQGRPVRGQDLTPRTSHLLLTNAIAVAVQRARTQFPKLKVEVEADTLTQVRQAVEAGADIILLDNMKPALLRRAVRIIAGRAKTEASGGVNLRTVRAIARTGVDFISVGALTHSARAVDIGLDHSRDT